MICDHCPPGEAGGRPQWGNATSTKWRSELPLMCFWCVRRHIAGALYDSVWDRRDPPEVSQKCQRWAEAEADDYLANKFGEV